MPKHKLKKIEIIYPDTYREGSDHQCKLKDFLQGNSGFYTEVLVVRNINLEVYGLKPDQYNIMKKEKGKKDDMIIETITKYNENEVDLIKVNKYQLMEFTT